MEISELLSSPRLRSHCLVPFLTEKFFDFSTEAFEVSLGSSGWAKRKERAARDSFRVVRFATSVRGAERDATSAWIACSLQSAWPVDPFLPGASRPPDRTSISTFTCVSPRIQRVHTGLRLNAIISNSICIRFNSTPDTATDAYCADSSTVNWASFLSTVPPLCLDLCAAKATPSHLKKASTHLPKLRRSSDQRIAGQSYCL